MTKEENINRQIAEGCTTNLISDGFHTFGELYDCRKYLNAALFKSWKQQGLFDVHKSKKHSDGELCFGGGWFIVVAELPDGQISYHYPLEDWNLFDIPARETPNNFDGHTTENVLARLHFYSQPPVDTLKISQ